MFLIPAGLAATLVIAQKQLPDRRRNSNIFKKNAMSEKWGQKNESSPLRFERGAGGYYLSDPDISDILFEKNRT
jgi:hypothetical protein